jgi:hypothetical protein
MAEPNLKISVASLNPADKEGFLTKQGGSIKTWKRRWFVLKGKRLVYFKTRNDLEATGIIELEPDSFVKDEKDKDKKRRFMFSVGTSRRVFFMHAETESEMKGWIDAIKRNIDGGGGHSPSPARNDVYTQPQSTYTQNHTTSTPSSNGVKPAPYSPAPTGNAGSPRGRLTAAKNCIPYLLEEQSKVLEFWQIWTESIPPSVDLQGGMAIEFHVATSADMQKLTWRTAGPQNIFIQKMVDFFWNVGAPESEIDRLNDVGALINPVKIGSWIDMSAKGGMDGGWYFPVEIPLKLAIEASDAGDPTRKVSEWAESNAVTTNFSVGRDMGAAPPRQTEIRMKLPGSDFSTQLRLALDAFFVFGFPAIPDDAIAVIRRAGNEASMSGHSLCLSVITSSEGFVRLGILIPKPNHETVTALSQLGQGSIEDIKRFEAALASQGPFYAEYQYLMKGFGYGVYKEGFDIVFHYIVGEERGD